MFSIIKRVLILSGEYRPRVIVGLIFNALRSCCAAFVFFAVLLVMMNVENLTEMVILKAFGIVVLSVLGRFLFQYLSDRLMSASGYEIFKEKRLEIGRSLKRAPMGYFTENNLGTVQAVLTTTISDLEGNCMLALTFLVGGFVQAFTMTVMLGVFCWQIGLLAFAGIIMGILVLGFIKRRAGEHTEDMQNAQELLVGSALEYIKGISVLRIFGKGTEGKGKIDEAFENKCRSDLSVTISTAGIMKLYEAVFKITSCVLFMLSAILYLNGTIELSHCLLFIICSFLMFMELELMSDGAFLSKMLTTQLDRLDLISDIPVLDTNGQEIRPTSFDIELSDVSFSYGERPVLNGLSLSIPENSTCAVIGPSGSGKTTLCNIIARFWDVNSGSVKIGGHDVREYTSDCLLSYVSMVFQKVYLFNDTIENNIKFGKPEASHEEVVEAAKRARCHEFIEALPDGYETVIGEGGSTLSGGEKQRISIARAILKDAPIVILDEATSSVDPENEKALLDAIFELTKNKTLISIAHRLSTVRNADQIIVIDEGKIVQKGTHEDLVVQEGIYRTFLECRKKSISWEL
jgi:ATP-binding cassette subfamily B protein